jgi:hypothetical protein
VLPYMFDYDRSGGHSFLSPRVNPSLPRDGIGVAVRPHGATTADAWLTVRDAQLDFVATAPVAGLPAFDKQWLAIDTNRRSKHYGRVYVSWAIGRADAEDEGEESSALEGDRLQQEPPILAVYESHADAHPDGTHTSWSRPKVVFARRPGFGDNGSIPRVAPNGTVWMTTSTFRGNGAGGFTPSLSSSRNGGATWAARRVIARHLVSDYDNTTFRAAFGESFAVGPRKVGKFYPLYLVYENGPSGPVGIYLRASFDGGRRWRAPIRVNDNGNGGEAIQPGIAVAPGGTVVVTFYDRRLPCPTQGTADATAAGLMFDPLAPYGRVNFCINTAVQLYRPGLRLIGHNVRMSPHTWDPQLSAARFACICSPGSFIGDYFGADARGGFAYTASVSTYNEGGTNPFFHQQQLVSKLRIP